MRFLVPTLLAALPLAAQTLPTPAFEVASIRQAPPTARGERVGRSGGPGTTSPTRIAWRFALPGVLAMQAYGVDYSRLKAPDWMLSAPAWDIQATVPEGTKPDDVPLMLRALLAERFALKTHWETEERVVYRITVAKSGLKLKIEEDDGRAPSGIITGAPGGGTLLKAQRYRMIEIVRLAEQALGDPGIVVLDETGITGVFTADLTFAPFNGPVDQAVAAPSFATALEQDWGLHVERSKGPVQILVVDEMRRQPTEN